MRIIVFSDSHGSTGCMRAALLDHPEADMIIHLGDGEHDLEKLSDLTAGKRIVQVCGNCDLYSFLPVNEIVDVNGTRIFCTHGFKELVKHGTEQLVEKAGGTVAGRMAVLAEGDAANRDDIIFLAPLPLFNPDGTVKE